MQWASIELWVTESFVLGPAQRSANQYVRVMGLFTLTFVRCNAEHVDGVSFFYTHFIIDF
jgi:hypothetical protein